MDIIDYSDKVKEFDIGDIVYAVKDLSCIELGIISDLKIEEQYVSTKFDTSLHKRKIWTAEVLIFERNEKETYRLNSIMHLEPEKRTGTYLDAHENEIIKFYNAMKDIKPHETCKR